ncbi:unnamed protein product [Nezara viridula]|uniref:Uncharacterized protein n=1 Tax=Nezara viridula TaxID=85310 RepID=A0A9P0E9U9_NEZVI|nr:unnamed protein product [Nezara viridula]
MATAHESSSTRSLCRVPNNAKSVSSTRNHPSSRPRCHYFEALMPLPSVDLKPFQLLLLAFALFVAQHKQNESKEQLKWL